MLQRHEELEVLVDEHGLLHVAVQLSSLVDPTAKFPRMKISFVSRDVPFRHVLVCSVHVC